MIVFRSIADAMRHGYHILNRTEYGYLARIRTQDGYAFAMIVLKRGNQPVEAPLLSS